MHPTVARYLSLDSALATLEKHASGAPLDAPGQAFARAAERLPDFQEALLAAKGEKTPGPEVEQMLMILAANAAAAELAEDPRFGPLIARGREALTHQGATADEIDAMIATAVLEEAVVGENGPDEFDADYVAETFETFPAMADVTEELVEDLLTLVGQANKQYVVPAKTLIGAAWHEGPQPMTVEHLEDAIAGLQQFPHSMRPLALEGMAKLLELMRAEKLVGPMRYERLAARLADEKP